MAERKTGVTTPRLVVYTEHKTNQFIGDISGFCLRSTHRCNPCCASRSFPASGARPCWLRFVETEWGARAGRPLIYIQALGRPPSPPPSERVESLLANTCQGRQGTSCQSGRGRLVNPRSAQQSKVQTKTCAACSWPRRRYPSNKNNATLK